jgi:hypothetical protein
MLLPSILLIMFIVPIFGMLEYMVSISKEYTCLTLLNSMVYKPAIRWMHLQFKQQHNQFNNMVKSAGHSEINKNKKHK